MKIQYAICTRLALGGIGDIAFHALEEIHKAGALGVAHCLDAASGTAIESAVARHRLAAKIGRIGDALGVLRTRSVFDLRVARELAAGDVFHAWCTPSLRSVRRAKQLGLKVVVECASTHPRHQYRVVTEEHKQWGHRTDMRAADAQRMAEQLAQADAVVVPAPQVAQTFAAQGFPAGKVWIAPFGVELERFVPDAGKPWNGAFEFLFVGQVSLRKGAHYLLQAFSKLRRPGAKLTLVGPVTADAKDTVAKLGAVEGVEFAGMQRDPSPYYKRAHACVFPSIEEGSALVSYEAMASGVPMIVTPEVGAVAAHGKEALVVPCRDVDALVAAMQRLYDDRALCQTLGAAGRATALQYPWSRYGRKVLECYADVLRR